MATICRLCLNSSATHYEAIASIEEKYFQLILPEIDIELVQSPMFCQSCIELLQTTYSFKSNCIETEKMLKLYASNYGEGQLLLNAVLQNNFWDKIQTISGSSGAKGLLNNDIKVESDDLSFGCDFDMSDDEYSCNVCRKNFDSEIELRRHRKLHKKPMKCKVCTASFPNIYTLRVHKRTHAVMPENKQLQCQICKVELDDTNKLIDHIKCHFKTFACTLCGNLCSDESSICEHLSTIHEVKVELSEKALRSRPEIEIKLDEKKYNLEVSHQLALHESFKNIAKGSSDDENSRNSEEISECKGTFRCEDCGTCFRKIKLLLDHIKRHYEHPHCIKCDKSYSYCKGLKNHLLNTHKIDMTEEHDEQLYTMNVDKEKLDESLQKHLELYKNVTNVKKGETSDSEDEKVHNRPYICNICEKAYYMKRHLFDHIRIHFTKSVCTLCDKRFYNVAVLKRHLPAVHQIDVSDDVTWREHIKVVVDGTELEQALKEHENQEPIDQDEYKSDSDDDQAEINEHHNINRPFKCDICNKSYTLRKHLLDHVKTHFEKPKCLQCEKRFYNVSAMKRHLARVHKLDTDIGNDEDTDGNWRDEINFDVNEDKMEQMLNRHLDLFEEDVTKIEKTEAYFDDADFTHTHVDEIANGRPFKCEMCNKSYNVRSSLLDHIKTHLRRPKCKLCNKSYYNIHCLKRHMQQLHNIEISTKPDNLNEHVKVEIVKKTSPDSEPPKYTCETCGKQFGHKSSIDRHKLTHSGQKSFICDFCQKGFLTKTYLERHISVCHLGIRPKRKMERNFTCDTCGLTTNNKYTLIQHIRIHTGERPYKCNVCGKAFAQSSSLGTHKRTVHSTERLFTCEYCSKSFNAKGSLTKHILEVHLVDKIEKKFICNYCGKKYRLQSQLNSHLKWHMADRQFSCDICGKPFVDKHSVKKHRVTHFAEKQHKCEICGKGFHQKYNIKIHMKVHSRVP